MEPTRLELDAAAEGLTSVRDCLEHAHRMVVLSTDPQLHTDLRACSTLQAQPWRTLGRNS